MQKKQRKSRHTRRHAHQAGKLIFSFRHSLPHELSSLLPFSTKSGFFPEAKATSFALCAKLATSSSDDLAVRRRLNQVNSLRDKVLHEPETPKLMLVKRKPHAKSSETRNHDPRPTTFFTPAEYQSTPSISSCCGSCVLPS